MSFTEKRLCNPTQLTTSGQTLYTVPSSKTAIIKQIVVTNVTGSPATFSLYIGSAATPNALFNATSVAGNDTIIVNLSQVLSQNEILTALASSNSTLNITISGVENDGPLNPLSTYIADEAITTAKLADSSVTTSKIAAGAVVNADIANNAVTQSKLASNLSAVTVTTSSLRSTQIPTPFDGQVIYETNTDRTLVWNGSQWVDISTGQIGKPGLVLISAGNSTGSSAYNYDGVFSSSFQNYRIILDRISVSVAGRAIRLNFRSNGSTNQDANYNYAYLGYKSTGVANNTSLGNPTFTEIGVYIDTAADLELGSSIIDIFSPFEAKRTRAVVSAQGYEGNTYWRQGGFEQYSINAFDGFRLTLNSTGNFSCTYAIYGYNQ